MELPIGIWDKKNDEGKHPMRRKGRKEGRQKKGRFVSRLEYTSCFFVPEITMKGRTISIVGLLPIRRFFNKELP